MDAADNTTETIDENYEEKAEYARYGTYGLAGLWVLTLLIFIFCYQSIKIAIAVLEAASDFVKEVKTTLFIPVLMFVIMSAFFVWWLVTALYLYTSGELAQITMFMKGHLHLVLMNT